jgi:CBS domain-containing protein
MAPERKDGPMKVKDVMTRHPVTASPETRLRDLARLLTDRQISGVPVVDADGRCIGVVSEADLLFKQLSRPLSRRLPLEWIIGERHDPAELRRRAALTAAEAMSAPAITITSDRPIREAAAVMVERKVNRLPVVDDGRLVGIITRSDMVRAYLRLDDEILAAVRDDVIRRTLWLDPATFEITVDDGVVHIVGLVDRRSTARILEQLVALVDGVVGVASTVTWELDDRHLQPPAAETEPTAASVTSREQPQPLHR